jgi:putative Mg2+ transporter-C (MgtC) family protein
MASPWAEIVIALAAVVCGAVIGTERERQQKSAGLRTLMLVCLGSAVLTMISFVFTSSTGDSGRVSAQIVTGIGFLGAGAILHSRSGVTGMTTAATIWITAAIGMTVGAGYPLAGFATCILVRTVLAGIYGFEIRYLGGMRSVTVELIFDPNHGKTRIHLDHLREEFHVEADLQEREIRNDSTVRATLNVTLARRYLHEFLDTLAYLPAVLEIRQYCETAAPANAAAAQRDPDPFT